MRFNLLLFSLLFTATIWPEGVDKKFQGFWLRHIDGKPYLSEITEDRIDEHECGGFSQLTDGQKTSKDCYAFADSGGDVYRSCFQVKGSKLYMKDEARGKKFTNTFTKYPGSLADFKKKYCPVTSANPE